MYCIITHAYLTDIINNKKCHTIIHFMPYKTNLLTSFAQPTFLEAFINSCILGIILPYFLVVYFISSSCYCKILILFMRVLQMHTLGSKLIKRGTNAVS